MASVRASDTVDQNTAKKRAAIAARNFQSAVTCSPADELGDKVLTARGFEEPTCGREKLLADSWQVGHRKEPLRNACQLR